MSASPESFLLNRTCDIATLIFFEYRPLTASSFALLLKFGTVFIAVVVVPRVERLSESGQPLLAEAGQRTLF